jgi:sugar phosphate isomerase/epimerase
MRIGLCCGLDVAPTAREAGFDYVEVATSGYATKDEFDPAEYRIVGAEASNVFFPGSIRLFGDQATPWRDYVDRALERASQIGIAVVVIGSGAARTAPEGVDPRDAEQRFVEIAAQIAARGREYGIPVAPESLGRAETNVGTDLGRLARLLADKGVGYTADSYHVLYEWREDGGDGVPAEAMWEEQVPFLPVHVHLGGLPRVAPWEDDSLMRGFAARLQALGYDGRVSVEASLAGADSKTLGEVLAGVKRLFA